MTAKIATEWLEEFRRRKNSNLPFRAMAALPLREWFAKNRICVFHHIPKCAGTSVVNVLGRWFFVKEDYRAFADGDWHANKRIDLDRLGNRHCLVGHFDYPGVYLHHRYPEVLSDHRYFLFTFFRDPLATKLSLFRYEKQSGVIPDMTLEEHLLTRDNYIANCLPCNSVNVEEILGRYDFIGVTEHIDESFRQLAKRLGRKLIAIPRLNTTQEVPHDIQLTPQLIEEFRQHNALDYRIYRYAVQRLLGL
jgi:hypothetical protein